ncbi:hypothetical protein PGT21_023116 [Puccinia graminis f. sp. tritici]|uniref:Uncharacterized protein n=1 Tax=Puccinia graminis f. sp. tritici TaxID=56615 RepID=A0A5B0P516_PUCGR|nr:hypothetical protein PGT21_023116 [Puccinia graminis f. sp. tritici]
MDSHKLSHSIDFHSRQFHLLNHSTGPMLMPHAQLQLTDHTTTLPADPPSADRGPSFYIYTNTPTFDRSQATTWALWEPLLSTYPVCHPSIPFLATSRHQLTTSPPPTSSLT